MNDITLTENMLRGAVDNYLAIRFIAQKFIQELHPKESVDEEDITLDHDGITWKYEKNQSCHCHPEMREYTHTYDFNKFMEWYYAL